MHWTSFACRPSSVTTKSNRLSDDNGILAPGQHVAWAADGHNSVQTREQLDQDPRRILFQDKYAAGSGMDHHPFEPELPLTALKFPMRARQSFSVWVILA